MPLPNYAPPSVAAPPVATSTGFFDTARDFTSLAGDIAKTYVNVRTALTADDVQRQGIVGQPYILTVDSPEGNAGADALLFSGNGAGNVLQSRPALTGGITSTPLILAAAIIGGALLLKG